MITIKASEYTNAYVEKLPHF